MARKKLNILITAGGTREYIDPVRYISNASSGRMGCAIARAAVRAGHAVTLITAPTSLKPPKDANVIRVVTCDDMFRAVRREFAGCDCLVMAAAVSDYKPAVMSKTKIKKEQSVLSLHLKPTRDILAWAGRNKKKGQMLVGFALEDKKLLENAEKKLKAKNLDMIVANEPDAIASDKLTVHIKSLKHDWITYENISKTISANRIVSMIQTFPIFHLE